MTVSTTTTAVSAAGDGSTTDFTFTFEILAAEDLKVIVVTDSTGAESEKTLTTDYTVAGVGQVSGGTVTFVTAPASGETVHIKRGNMALTQPTNYTPNDPFPAETHENALDRMALQIQQINEKVGRAVVRSETDSASAQLPTNETLKGKTLAFNETTGAVEAGPSIADVDTVSGIAADIATLADIEDGTDATDAIQTVANISGDVTTVSGISSDVTNVSNNAASVSTVAGDSANISTVAGNITDVATVSSNITSVSTVASNISDVVTVANDLNEAISEVETVANDLNEAVSEIDTVATSISSVQTVGTNIANVNTVAGIDSDVTTVSGISGNVTTVAGISSDVTTVSGVSADVSTVSGVSANVTTVAGISSDVTTVAGNSANVTTVATDITNVNTVASNIADVNNFALTYRIAASAPTTSLDEGDLYFNTTLNQMFVYDGSAWVSVSPDLVGDTSPQLGGDLDVNGNAITGSTVAINGSNGELMISATENGPVALRYDNNLKLTTKSDGVNITGELEADSLDIDGAADITGNLTVDTNTLYVDSTNNRVGIGTTAPAQNLHIENTSASVRQRFVTGTTNQISIDFGDTDSGTVGRITYDHYTDAMAFQTNASERMRINSSGFVGIGESAPEQKLHISGIFLLNNNQEIRFKDSGGSQRTAIAMSSNDLNIGTSAGGNLKFYNGSSYTERMRIDSSGRVGIGTTGPATPLDVRAASPFIRSTYDSTGTYVQMFHNGSNGYFDFSSGGLIWRGAGQAERMRLDSSGRLGIGQSSPSAALHILDTSTPQAKIAYDSNRYMNVEHATIYNVSGAAQSNNLKFATRGNSGNNNITFFTGGTDASGTSESQRLLIANNGDISFYNSTGVSQDFFWDSSASRLTLSSSDYHFGISTSGNQPWYLRGVSDGSFRLHLNGTGDIVTATTNGNLQVGATSGRGGAATGHLFKMPSGDVYFEIMGSTTSANTDILFSDGTGGSYGVVGYDHTNDALRFFANSGEKMRIDSSGNLLVSKTSSNSTTDGIELRGGSGAVRFIGKTDSNAVGYLNRGVSDGNILEFAKDNSAVGAIGTNGGRVFISGPDAGGIKFDQYGATNGAPLPCDSSGAKADDVHDFGVSDARWDDIYATNGTIQTSDQNEKNTITDSDLGLDFINRLTPKSYIFNGKSRTHYGLIAQEVETVLDDIGKPTSGFAGFIKGDISPDRDGSAYRYGLRYTEFVGPLIKALQEADDKIEALEARIAALEAN